VDPIDRCICFISLIAIIALFCILEIEAFIRARKIKIAIKAKSTKVDLKI